MKISKHILTFLCLAAIVACLPEKKEKITNIIAGTRPNVILIMTDDQGYGDLGCMGNPYLYTPHIDKFSESCTQFSNFYVDPVCAPTRSALMTGRFYLRNGIYDTFNGGAIMDPEQHTIAEIFSENGYKTGIYGKWHLGDNYPSRPQDQGFSASLVHKGGGIGQPGDLENFGRADSSYFDPILWKNGMKVNTRGYCTDVFTDGALEFIDSNRDDPFFLYVSYNAPHDPLQVPEKYLEKYQDLKFEQGTTKEGLELPELNDSQASRTKRVYAMVENIDDNVGRILNKLEEQNLLDNSVVIFMSDNGPTPIRYNAGLRAKKGTVYEGGIKVPFFIHYPKMFKAGNEIETPAAHVDILPTLLDICGMTDKTPEEIDGKSLLPLLKGDTQWHEQRTLVWQWGRCYPQLYSNIAIRKGRYKLIGNTGMDADIADFELFNLEADPGEKKNLVDEEKEIALQLKNDIDSWYHKTVIVDGHPKHQGIVVDFDKEYPVELSRNDARGYPEVWGRDEVYAFWDVDFAQEGYYDITFKFREAPGKSGNFVLKMAPIQYYVSNTDPDVTELRMKNRFIPKGRNNMEVYYHYGFNQILIPFSLTIEKSSNKN